MSKGAVHEHMRPDRDMFVTINYENIKPGSEANFERVDSSTHHTRNTPFDFESIMMYGPHDFGKIDSSGRARVTIQPKRGGVDMRQVWEDEYFIALGTYLKRSNCQVLILFGMVRRVIVTHKKTETTSFLCRETETKTELSLVDKIELARAYQPITGGQEKGSSYLLPLRQKLLQL